MGRLALLVCLALLWVGAAQARDMARTQRFWCDMLKGREEQPAGDGSKVDCLTEDSAIEFEFERQWAEAVGQALHYARLTGRKAVVYLVVDDLDAESLNLRRLEDVVAHYKLPIEIRAIGAFPKDPCAFLNMPPDCSLAKY